MVGAHGSFQEQAHQVPEELESDDEVAHLIEGASSNEQCSHLMERTQQTLVVQNVILKGSLSALAPEKRSPARHGCQFGNYGNASIPNNHKTPLFENSLAHSILYFVVFT